MTGSRAKRGRSASGLPSGSFDMPGLRVGLRVRAKYLATTGYEFQIPWYSASVVAVNEDGSCDVAYDDGEMERNVAAHNVQVCSSARARAVSGDS